MHSEPGGRQPQRGAALPLVLLLCLLSCLVVLAGARRMLMAEAANGAAADHARAFAAAQALLRDAEADVLGAWPDGRLCGPPDASAGCRPAESGVFFPLTAADRDRVADTLATDPARPCRHGVCIAGTPGLPAPPQDMAEPGAGRPPSFATYGQFTAAAGSGLPSDPYLGPQARYWVEVLDYVPGSGIAGGGSRYQPDPLRPFVFRITALAPGLRPGTRVVLREIFVPSPLASAP